MQRFNIYYGFIRYKDDGSISIMDKDDFYIPINEVKTDRILLFKNSRLAVKSRRNHHTNTVSTIVIDNKSNSLIIPNNNDNILTSNIILYYSAGIVKHGSIFLAQDNFKLKPLTSNYSIDNILKFNSIQEAYDYTKLMKDKDKFVPIVLTLNKNFMSSIRASIYTKENKVFKKVSDVVISDNYREYAIL